MLLLATLAFASAASAVFASVADDECPALPDPEFSFGKPVEVIPSDIPDGCSNFEIIVARGTSEPNSADGKFGVIVGDPIVSNATQVLAGIQGYPVQYPADSNFVENLEKGGTDIVARIVSQSEKCPEQRFAIVGYSQGAGIAHKAAEFLPLELQYKISSISVFGDPSQGENAGNIWPVDWPYGLQHKVRSVCAEGDPVCDVTAPCFYYHLTYILPFYIDPAVDYIVDNFVNTWQFLPHQSKASTTD